MVLPVCMSKQRVSKMLIFLMINTIKGNPPLLSTLYPNPAANSNDLLLTSLFPSMKQQGRQRPVIYLAH